MEQFEPGIATVNQKGVITAVAEGSTVITAESLLIPGKKIVLQCW